MKHICLISSYTPTIDRQDVLRNLIRFLKKNNQDIFLISHSQTPSDIISDVDYFLYDSKNEFLTDKNSIPWYHVSLFDGILYSRDVIKKSTTILPATRNILFGLLNCKLLGYEIAHYIEYDTILNGFETINNNNKLIKEFNYDYVIYETKGYDNEDSYLFGPYSVYNLNSYSLDDLLWDREKILDVFYQNDTGLLVERVFEHFLTKPKSGLRIPNSEIENCDMVFDTVHGNSLDNSLNPKILFADNNELHLYCDNKNPKKIDESVEVVINNDYYIKLPTIKPETFYFITLGQIENFKTVKIFTNNVITFEYDLSSTDKIKEFKQNNFLKKS
jgi:hypothetical protein